MQHKDANYIMAILDSRKKFVAHERFQYVLLKKFGETDMHAVRHSLFQNLKFCRKAAGVLVLPTEQCSNLAAKISFCYGSWLRTSQLFTVLTGVVFQSMRPTVPGMETISTRAELKEHSIMDHLAT